MTAARRAVALAFGLGCVVGLVVLGVSSAPAQVGGETVPAATRIWNTVPRFAIPTRCVNAAGTAFEACGGAGSVTVGGTVAVTDNAGSLTVDGTVAATQSGAWNVGQSGTWNVADGAGSLTVDGTVTCTPSGTQTVAGTVAATQSGAWSVGQTGAWTVTANAGTGTLSVNTEAATATTTPGASDVGFVVRNIPSGTQAVSGTIAATQSGTWNVADGGGLLSVDDGAGSLTVDGTVTCTPSGTQTVTGTVAATQSGTWNVGDGGGALTVDGTVNGVVLDGNGVGQADVLNAAPTTQYGLVTRNIPSGTQTIQGTVTGSGTGFGGLIADGAGAGLADVIGVAPTTEQGLVTRNIPSGTQTIQGTVSGNGTGFGGLIADGAAAGHADVIGVAPTTEQGLVVRNIPSGTQNVSIVTGSGDFSDVYAPRGGNGQITRPLMNEPLTYSATINGSAPGAAKDFLTLWNASGTTAILRVRKVVISPYYTGAVTGTAQTFHLYRITQNGTTCTTVTPLAWDSANSALPAQVSANSFCSSDGTPETNHLLSCTIQGDESLMTDSGNVCWQWAEGSQAIVLRASEGLMIKSAPTHAANFNVTASIIFTSDPT